MRPSRAELVVLGLLLVSAHGARGQAIGQGFELERAGQYQRAATVYLTTLRGEPTNLAALLGLERVLPSLNRAPDLLPVREGDRKSTRLNSSHLVISYAVFCLKKKKKE